MLTKFFQLLQNSEKFLWMNLFIKKQNSAWEQQNIFIEGNLFQEKIK